MDVCSLATSNSIAPTGAWALQYTRDSDMLFVLPLTDGEPADGLDAFDADVAFESVRGGFPLFCSRTKTAVRCSLRCSLRCPPRSFGRSFPKEKGTGF
jgi:hypothetical protein